MIIDKIRRLFRSGCRQFKKFWQIGFVVTMSLCISFLCSFTFKSYAKYSSAINVTVTAEAGALNMGCTVTDGGVSNNYSYFVVTVTNTSSDVESDVDIEYTLTIKESESDEDYTAVGDVYLSYKDGYGEGNGTDSFDSQTLTITDTVDLDNYTLVTDSHYENKINVYVYYLNMSSTDVQFDVELDAHQVTS